MENDIRIRIGQRIKAIRESKGLSIRQLSELTGINHSNISAIENGKYNARLDTLEKFESVFGVHLEIIED